MINVILVIVLMLFFQNLVFASQVKVASKHSVEDTVKLYEKALNAAKVPLLAGKPFKKNLPGGFLRTGKEIQFTHPFYGRSLGECHRGVRKDQPMKTLIYQDANGQVWLEYAKSENQMNSFGVIECGNETEMVNQALGSFADAATD